MDKKVTLEDCFTSFSEEHTEDEMKDMIRQFVNNCFAQLLDKSVPVLRAGGEERYRRQWILFPKKMLESGYGETLMAEMKSYLDRNGGSEYSIVGTEAQEIVCYQSVLAIPLYELDGLWKWEQCYNKKIETKTLDWKHYFPLALRHLNRNTVNKKFYEEFFSPCIDYALKEKIIERKRFPGEEWKYLYVMNLIPDSWTNLNVSNYKVGDAEGRAQKGEAFFQYLHSMNSFSADVWQREITLPDAGVFSRAYDFSDAPEGMDIDGISISYMKRILQKNVPLFVLLRQTVKKYMRMQRDIDELRIAPAQTGKQAPEDTGMHRTEKPLQTDPPVVKKMKYCKFCGKELKTGVEKFCSKCGRQLRE